MTINLSNNKPFDGDHSKNQVFFEANSLDEAINGLLRKMRITSGARFYAAKRHKKRYRTSSVSIVLLSVYAITISIIPAFVTLERQYVSATLSMVSVFISVMVIAFSLMEAAKRHDYRSDLFLKCAQQILELHDKIKIDHLANKISWKELHHYSDKYHNFLNSFLDNHSDLDMHAFMANDKQYNFIWRKYKKILYISNIWIMPILALTSPGIIFGAILIAREAYKLL